MAGASRSMQSRSAVVSPPCASSMHLRVNASASPSRSAWTAIVALWRVPLGLPDGLPETPFGHRLLSWSPPAFSGDFGTVTLLRCHRQQCCDGNPTEEVAAISQRPTFDGLDGRQVDGAA